MSFLQLTSIVVAQSTGKAKSRLPKLGLTKITGVLDKVAVKAGKLGPVAGPLTFGGAYVGAELLSIPPAPLAAASGLIFGPLEGTLIVLASGTIAAMIAFLVGRCFRENFIASVGSNDSFKKIDALIVKGGMRAILLLRLIPTPLPGINYLYGVTGIDFIPYMIGTAVGYLPSSLAIVLSGVAGKEIFSGKGRKPLWIYAAVAVLGAAFMWFVIDTGKRTLGVDEW